MLNKKSFDSVELKRLDKIFLLFIFIVIIVFAYAIYELVFNTVERNGIIMITKEQNKLCSAHVSLSGELRHFFSRNSCSVDLSKIYYDVEIETCLLLSTDLAFDENSKMGGCQILESQNTLKALNANCAFSCRID